MASGRRRRSGGRAPELGAALEARVVLLEGLDDVLAVELGEVDVGPGRCLAARGRHRTWLRRVVSRLGPSAGSARSGAWIALTLCSQTAR